MNIKTATVISAVGRSDAVNAAVLAGKSWSRHWVPVVGPLKQLNGLGHACAVVW